jgi:hypothetical protein
MDGWMDGEGATGSATTYCWDSSCKGVRRESGAFVDGVSDFA